MKINNRITEEDIRKQAEKDAENSKEKILVESKKSWGRRIKEKIKNFIENED